MPSLPSDLTLQVTADGSLTLVSGTVGEAFHSHSGAWQEAEGKFVLPCRLAELAVRPAVTLMDVCYGLGYNTAAALTCIWRINPVCQVTWYGFEGDGRIPALAWDLGCFSHLPLRVQQVIAGLAEHQVVTQPYIQGRLWLGDARQTLPSVVAQGVKVDALFLDPFSPPRCPQLWTVEFLGEVAQALAPAGRLATYCSAAAVRAALHLAGLGFGPTPPVGRRAPGTVASWNPTDLPPLSLAEQEHLLTRAAIPYRDPYLQDDPATIHQRRTQEQALSDLEPAGRWRARWATLL